MSKEYQSYDRRRKDVAFGGQLASLFRWLRLVRSCSVAGFRRSILLLIGFDSWSSGSICRPLSTSINVHGRRVGC
jgi:hypothetical protein